MVDIYDYLDYRRFLNDVIAENGGKRTGRTLRAIARNVGFDPSFFSKILKGKRNLSADDGQKIAQAISLDQDQTSYFHLIVRFNQARNRETQRHCFDTLLELRRPKTTAVSHERYYSQWYYPVIRELLHFYPFSGNFPALAAMLVPPVKPHHVRQTVQVLEELGIIVQDSHSYRLRAPFVTAGPEVKRAVLHSFQAAMMELGKEALGRFTPEERDISGFTLSLSREGVDEVRDAVKKFKARVMEIARNDTGINGVYQINVQAFPLSRVYEEITK